MQIERVLAGLLALLTTALAIASEPHPGTDTFIRRAVDEFGFDPGQVEAVLAEAQFKQSIVDAMTRPAEAKPWFEYRPIFLTERRIREGAEFWRNHRELIDRVAGEFDVDPQIIVAIIGVETFYGRISGGYRVIDALATLGFYYPKELARDRSEFFSGELLQFLLLGQEERLPLTEVTGSYAGAMGMGQFIPSSYRAYAVDFDGDGRRDLWRSTPDAVASVANYLHRHGWEAGGPVAHPATVEEDADLSVVARGDYRPELSVAKLAAHGFRGGSELSPDRQAAVLELEQRERPAYWLIFDNFYVITRYNRSPLYAMAVWQLSEEILGEMGES